MQFGALIVAAGMSSRMGEFKPMLNIGSIAMLLTLVDEKMSMRTACQHIQISYSTGWNLLRRLETELGRTLVARSQGGHGGGQSRLTEDGRLLLARYNEFERRLRAQTDLLFQDCFGEVL